MSFFAGNKENKLHAECLRAIRDAMNNKHRLYPYISTDMIEELVYYFMDSFVSRFPCHHDLHKQLEKELEEKKKCESPSQGETKDNSRSNLNCPSDPDEILPPMVYSKYAPGTPAVEGENKPFVWTDDKDFLKLYDRVHNALNSTDSIPKMVTRLTETELYDIMRFFRSHAHEHLPSKVLGEDKPDTRKPSVRLKESEDNMIDFYRKLARDLGFENVLFCNEETGQRLLPWVKIHTDIGGSELKYFASLDDLLAAIRGGKLD